MPRAGRPLRVAIVTREEVVARGLVAMLSDYPDRIVVTTLPATRSSAAGVDVVLYDTLGLRGSESVEASKLDLSHLLTQTSARVLLFSRDTRPDLRARGLALGCDAWVPMSTRADDLVAAIEATAAGVPTSPYSEPLGDEFSLTAREVEVAALVAQGLDNTTICSLLHLSPNTLKTHIRNLYRKIGAGSRAQAVSWAIRHGYAPHP